MSTKITSLVDLFKLIVDGLSEGKTLKSMSNLLENYSGSDWSEHVVFCDNSYNRKNVFCHDLAELVVITWKKNQKTTIHDHPNGGCCLKVMLGTLSEDTYSENADIFLNTSHLDENSISYREGKKILHQITAFSESVSIHIYAPSGYKSNLYL